MTMRDTLLREMRAIELDARVVKRVRVTSDAIQGAPVATPISPERLRLLALRQLSTGGVVADGEAQEEWREVLVHPTDWVDILTEEPFTDGVLDLTGPICRVYGVEVDLG